MKPYWPQQKNRKRSQKNCSTPDKSPFPFNKDYPVVPMVSWLPLGAPSLTLERTTILSTWPGFQGSSHVYVEANAKSKLHGK